MKTVTSEETVDARVVRRDRKIYLVLLTVLVALVVLLSLSLRENTKKAQTLQDELDLERWIVRLQVPSEALYLDPEFLSETAKLRAKLHTDRGTKTFLPYSAVTMPSGSAGEMPAVVPQSPVPADDAGALFQASYEQFWHTRSWAACEMLADQIETNDGMGRWFLGHREVFDERIRPLLLRILESYHPWPRRSACRVLIAIGDRDPALKMEMERLVEEPSDLNQADRAQMKERLEAVRWP